MPLDIEFSKHTIDMIIERSIPEEWVWLALNFPDRKEIGTDENTHYIKMIPENNHRFLRVIVNEQISPNIVVTVFFDRRIRS